MQGISSASRPRRWWDALVFLTSVAACLEVLPRLIFDHALEGWLLRCDLSVTAVLLVDTVLHLFTRPPGRGPARSDAVGASRAGTRGWLVIDLLSALPFDLVASAAPAWGLGPPGLLRTLALARLLRLGRLAWFLGRWKRESALNPSILRLGTLAFWILLGTHFIACAWLLLGSGNSAGTSGDYSPDDHLRYYIRSVYWTTTTITTIGYGDIAPVTNVQTVFCMFVQLLGAGMYGFIIGVIANLIANIDVAKAQFRDRMEKVETFMKYKAVPTETREKVRGYYQYLWETRRGQDEFSVIGDFPPPLKAEVLLFLNREMIEKVPVFRGARPDFVREIVLALRPVVFSPGEYVFRKGEVGHDMYFISRGSVEVVSVEGRTVFATLQEGNFFGEIALLTAQPRTASIRCVGYTDLYQLDQDTFQRVLKRFPDFERHIGDLARKRHDEITRVSVDSPAAEPPGPSD